MRRISPASTLMDGRVRWTRNRNRSRSRSTVEGEEGGSWLGDETELGSWIDE